MKLRVMLLLLLLVLSSYDIDAFQMTSTTITCFLSQIKLQQQHRTSSTSNSNSNSYTATTAGNTLLLLYYQIQELHLLHTQVGRRRRRMLLQSQYTTNTRSEITLHHNRFSNCDNEDTPSSSENDGNVNWNDHTNGFDMTATTTLRHRMYPLQIQSLEEIYERSSPTIRIGTESSSSSSLLQQQQQQSPIQQFIAFSLHCLLHNDVPYPDSGIRYLLRISTPKWRQQIYQSIGYVRPDEKNDCYTTNNKNNTVRSFASSSSCNTSTNDINYDVNNIDITDGIVSSISTTIFQINNQFGILVGEGEQYRIISPSEPFEYDEFNYNSNVLKNNTEIIGVSSSPSSSITTTVWIECQLRDYHTNELLVMMGWQLQKETHNQHHHLDDDDDDDHHYVSYKIDRIDWQDFRDRFRPGIGREEWVRICG